MPKIEDIKKVLVIGSGPIVIGQAAEFDYAGTQACRVLNEAGVHAKQINKLEEESPNLLDLILDDKIDLVIDTPSQGVGRSRDGFLIRRYAIETGVTCLTSLDTADALLTSLETGNRDQLSVVDIAQI